MLKRATFIGAPAAVMAVAMAASPVFANPNMSYDFQNMMSWLSNQVVQGLGFNAGETFDPPNEIRPWRLQPDLSLGIGVIPLDKSKFPSITTPSLAEKNPQNVLPDKVQIPNLALHLRFGLPGRMDFTIRGADMTIPKGYQLSPGTYARGQSNSIGFGLRKHFLGREYDDMPLVSVSAHFNHVKGFFDFFSQWQRLELTPGFNVDSKQTGRLEWNVNSVGMNTVVSQTYGAFTPFIGAGLNHMSGSMKSRLQADFASPLVTPVLGEASDHPEQFQTRAILGAQFNLAHVSLFLNSEIKTSGAMAGKTFIVHTGAVCPFGIGFGSLVAKGTKALTPTGTLADNQDEPWRVEDGERIQLRDSVASFPAPKAREKDRRAEKPEWVSPDAGEEKEPLFKPKPSRRRPAVKPAKRHTLDDKREMIFIY